MNTLIDLDFLIHYEMNSMTKEFITIIINTAKENLTVVKHNGSYKEPNPSSTISRATFESSNVIRKSFIS